MNKILIVNPFGLGDALFSMALAEEIRRAWPESVIGFMCNERTEGLVRMNPSLDRVFVFNRDEWRSLWKRKPLHFFSKLKAFLRLILDADFDILIDLSLSRQYSFFAMLVGIKRRVGFDYKGRGLFLTQKKKIAGYENKHVIDIQSELLQEIGIAASSEKIKIPLVISEAASKRAEAIFSGEKSKKDCPILCVAPGGGRSWGSNAFYKQWDAERFAAVAKTWQNEKGYRVVILGDESERELLERVAKLIGAQATLCVGEAIPVVSHLLRSSRALLCNDGGLLHLADALDVPTVSIFGPVDETVYGPYWGKRKEVLKEDVPCRPCYHRFRFPPCPYERRCLSELTLEKVSRALERVA